MICIRVVVHDRFIQYGYFERAHNVCCSKCFCFVDPLMNDGRVISNENIKNIIAIRKIERKVKERVVEMKDII